MHLLPVAVLFISVICFGSYVVQGEVFTSVSHMLTLVDTEQKLRLSLRRYIREEENRLSRLQSFLNDSVSLLSYSKGLNDDELPKYIGNPVNIIHVLGRFMKNWKGTELLLRTDFSKDLISKLRLHTELFPSDEDLKGAQDALVRLQETYDLEPAIISEGIAPKNYPISKMNAQDTFAIGRKAYLEDNFQRTQLWMAETLRLLDMGRMDKVGNKISRSDVLDHLAWAEYTNGDIEKALNHTLELNTLAPGNQRIEQNIKQFRNLVAAEKEKNKKLLEQKKLTEEKTSDKAKDSESKDIFPKFYYTEEEDEYQRYLLEKEVAQRLCRGKTKPIPKYQTKYLVCWYMKRAPLFLIKPVKLERIFVKPEIVFYKGIISDEEISKVKELAGPKLYRATVHNPKTGKIEFADYRVSKSAWLDDYDDPLISKINQRIEDLTGLSMETAEMLQVANYGIGGHYETHFDFSRYTPIRPPPWKPAQELTHRLKHEMKKNANLMQNGNRIATFLMYMSDVELGGGTVFTNIGAMVTPRKGDAVFWYNLYRDGSGDFDTRHAACPVLIGEKWVANKWIHERGQEFRHRCGLTRSAA